MADPKVVPLSGVGANCFKEAVCINASRIFDSCSDKDCLEDLQVCFTDAAQPIIDRACSVKVKDVNVLNVFLDVEPVAFNRGFYSVDMTFCFMVRLEVFTSPMCHPAVVTGFSSFCKKVILFGSEAKVKTFLSGHPYVASPDGIDQDCPCMSTLPQAAVNVADPVVLSCRLCECPRSTNDCICSIPASIANRFEGDFGCVCPLKTVYVSLGLFSIVQLEREVQLMVPTYDYCIPDKECNVSNSDDPCELFKKIKFPTDEFFPRRLQELDADDNDRCGSCGNSYLQ